MTRIYPGQHPPVSLDRAWNLSGHQHHCGDQQQYRPDPKTREPFLRHSADPSRPMVGARCEEICPARKGDPADAVCVMTSKMPATAHMPPKSRSTATYATLKRTKRSRRMCCWQTRPPANWRTPGNEDL